MKVLQFKGLHNKESCCHFEIHHTEPTVVIIVDTKEDSGTSSVNAIETVVTDIVKDNNLDPETTVFIHYAPPGFGLFTTSSQEFYKVPLKWNGQEFEMTTSGSWKSTNRSSVEELIGKILEI